MTVARCKAAAAFQRDEAAFNAVAQSIDGVVDRVLDELVALDRYFWLGGAVLGVLADGITVVAATGEKNAGIAVPIVHQVRIGGAVVCPSGCQKDANGQALSVDTKVDLDREATARAAKTLALILSLAPAAQWYARTTVLSIICRASASPPLSAKAYSSTSHRPPAVKLRNCRSTEFRSPSSGRQIAPGHAVRAIQKMASNWRRWSVSGRPRSGSPSIPRPESSFKSHPSASGELLPSTRPS